MDLVLDLADDFVLDDFWARVVPLSAFAGFAEFPGASANVTGIKYLARSSSTWSQLTSHLPHPSLPSDKLAGIYSNSQSPSLLSAWPRDYIPRQVLSTALIMLVGVHILYFLFAGFSYKYVFNHDMMRHPRFLPNQVRLEIIKSLQAFPVITLLMLPWFQAEVMGYSKLYARVDDYGYVYLFASVPLFLMCTDYGIYWIHRWLHIPFFYKHLHKPHHKWIIPTPFGAYAFHPVDGYLQSIPYHVFVFVFPLHRVLFLALFVFVNIWTVFIHDSDMITGHFLEKLVNGPAHHTLHHMYFTVNYGQYFTWADRMGGSYRQPESYLDPLLEVKALKED